MPFVEGASLSEGKLRAQSSKLLLQPLQLTLHVRRPQHGKCEVLAEDESQFLVNGLGVLVEHVAEPVDVLQLVVERLGEMEPVRWSK